MPLDQTFCATKHETALIARPIDALAREVNEAHRAVQLHSKGMLFEARRAGEALIQIRDVEKPAKGFKAWIEANCRFSRPQAYRYIAVAERWNESCLGAETLVELTIEQFVGEKTKGERKPVAAPPFTRDDAEYALKIHALAERGEGGEADNAKAKLESLAEQHGMDTEKMVEKAQKLCPPPNPDPLVAKLQEKSKSELIDINVECIKRIQRLKEDLEMLKERMAAQERVWRERLRQEKARATKARM